MNTTPDDAVTEQRILTALHEHAPAFDERCHVNGTVPGRGAWGCTCGLIANATHRDAQAHVAHHLAEAVAEADPPAGTTFVTTRTW
ncbi:hypothetical protein MARA_18440 [Mycolicibacterium arabiense]|uniref:Uncharacterized protein n=1 Tax=Mycolicibacterium arabiense TaxID=1286181 RepID=A0A7I7RWL2_9MYCO|nr:hypothetical protein [Mycolicibacterium arabiense]MCV7375231.1 hypothetical protein [Mycolicibacterium arabiense]BBY48376.1 hypothetical protein MARA_18440 [Mycolicibacterium arabiense]